MTDYTTPKHCEKCGDPESLCSCQPLTLEQEPNGQTWGIWEGDAQLCECNSEADARRIFRALGGVET